MQLSKNDLIELLQTIEGNPNVYLIDIENDDCDGVPLEALKKTSICVSEIQDYEGNKSQGILISHKNYLAEEYYEMREKQA